MNKAEELKRILCECYLKHVDISNERSLDVVHDLYANGIKYEDLGEDSVVYYYYGYFYKHVEINYDLMKKYYAIAIDKGNNDAMISLGQHYQLHEKKYELTKKYYDMAIENGSDEAAVLFAEHCKNVGDFDQMIKYYLIAISKGNLKAMKRLSFYYHSEGNYDEMIKYERMAIEKGDCEAMIHLAKYYHEKESYNEMKKYYLMAIDKGSIEAMERLGNYYNRYCIYNKMLEYYLMILDHGPINSIHIKAMLKLARYYLDKERDINSMRKYYLMAFENGSEEGIIKLAEYYQKKKEYDRMRYYLLQGAVEIHSKQCMNKINQFLASEFDIDFAFEAYEYLDEHNLDKVNKIICKVIRLSKDEPTNMLSRFCCLACKQENIECVFMKCGHPICYQCYGKACPLCSNSK